MSKLSPLSQKDIEQLRKQRISRGQCAAGCGDAATVPYKGKFYCRECFDELFIGKISFEPANLHSGRDA